MKKNFDFYKICFKVTVLKMLKIFTDRHMLFLLALKWNLYEKAFSSVKTKTNPNFVLKLAERSKHPFLLFDESHFSNICTNNQVYRT